MKRVAVLGGGPAGSFAAERLARGGLDTVLIDEKLAWEKPCGGGITCKAWREYPFLKENGAAKRYITETSLTAPGAGAATLRLSEPLLIYSRFDLNGMLLQRAERAGAHIERTRVTGLVRRGSGWTIRTTAGAMEADFCIVAMGARNPVREVGTEWAARDTMTALGYYVESSTQTHIDVQFIDGFEGYIWVFPRCGHASVGICGKGVPAQQMRAMLERYMDERGIARRGSRFYAHMLPSLEPGSWKRNRLAGEGWMAVGDSAGLVDPITGEGLYYAMRSGDLAAQALLDDAWPVVERGRLYRSLLHSDFGADLEFAATISRRFYLGRFLFGSIPGRMVQFARQSSRFYYLVDQLFSGAQQYRTLRRRVYRDFACSALQLAKAALTAS
jgi:geranylgeranyl reductase family protein